MFVYVSSPVRYTVKVIKKWVVGSLVKVTDLMWDFQPLEVMDLVQVCFQAVSWMLTAFNR